MIQIDGKLEYWNVGIMSSHRRDQGGIAATKTQNISRKFDAKSR